MSRQSRRAVSKRYRAYAGSGVGGIVMASDDGASSNRKRTIALVVLVLIVFVSAFLAWAHFSNGDWYDSSAKQGSYSGKSQEEIVADLNRKIDEGMMNISISSVLRFPDGTLEPGTANIENIAANNLDQKVSIALADTGEVLYESDAIAPGHTIETIRLNRDLKPGTYDAVATFVGFDPESHNECGRLAVELSLVSHG